jgi:FMNH2-dependent dimethyl sulfone monooxygenase
MRLGVIVAVARNGRNDLMEKFRTPVLNGDNALKLGIFGINLRGGVTLADVEGKVQGTWDENVRLAQWADRLGLDAVVPIARWRGYGGAANLGDRSFETFTWATGLMAATTRIQAFATIHVPLALQEAADGAAVLVDVRVGPNAG